MSMQRINDEQLGSKYWRETAINAQDLLAECKGALQHEENKVKELVDKVNNLSASNQYYVKQQQDYNKLALEVEQSNKVANLRLQEITKLEKQLEQAKNNLGLETVLEKVRKELAQVKESYGQAQADCEDWKQRFKEMKLKYEAVVNLNNRHFETMACKEREVASLQRKVTECENQIEKAKTHNAHLNGVCSDKQREIEYLQERIKKETFPSANLKRSRELMEEACNLLQNE